MTEKAVHENNGLSQTGSVSAEAPDLATPLLYQGPGTLAGTSLLLSILFFLEVTAIDYPDCHFVFKFLGL